MRKYERLKMFSKAQGLQMQTIIIAILVLIVLVTLIVIFTQTVDVFKKGTSAVSATQDEVCKKTTIAGKLITGTAGPDTDGDGRDDLKCDSCVCDDPRCHNDGGPDGKFDLDGDKLPSACDEDDSLKTGRKTRIFSKANCPKESLLDLKIGKQCRPNIGTKTAT